MACGVHGEQNHLLKLWWYFANCVEEVEIYVSCVYQLQHGAWACHCSSWCSWCICMVHDILWGWERCAGCSKMGNIVGWRHSRYLIMCECVCVFVCVCAYVYVCVCVCVCECLFVFLCVWNTCWYKLLYFWIQKICYRLLCCNKHR